MTRYFTEILTLASRGPLAFLSPKTIILENLPVAYSLNTCQLRDQPGQVVPGQFAH